MPSTQMVVAAIEARNNVRFTLGLDASLPYQKFSIYIIQFEKHTNNKLKQEVILWTNLIIITV
ncbi:MAG: hypothetical protein PHO93_03315 [Candidatus Saccharimonadaceae bacterium]|nr:hypothetical protein [Candidatus Saccharimonadaceae bacterium]